MPASAPASLDPERLATLRRIRSLSRLLDNSIRLPFINYRIGWDVIIGLVPGVGDLVGTALSTYIIVEAARLGATRGVLARMVFNVMVETVVGSIPILGDVFDAIWKANVRNMRLLERSLGGSAGFRAS